jgi:hypothetical protein
MTKSANDEEFLVATPILLNSFKHELLALKMPTVLFCRTVRSVDIISRNSHSVQILKRGIDVCPRDSYSPCEILGDARFRESPLFPNELDSAFFGDPLKQVGKVKLLALDFLAVAWIP